MKFNHENMEKYAEKLLSVIAKVGRLSPKKEYTESQALVAFEDIASNPEQLHKLDLFLLGKNNLELRGNHTDKELSGATLVVDLSDFKIRRQCLTQISRANMGDRYRLKGKTVLGDALYHHIKSQIAKQSQGLISREVAEILHLLEKEAEPQAFSKFNLNHWKELIEMNQKYISKFTRSESKFVNNSRCTYYENTPFDLLTSAMTYNNSMSYNYVTIFPNLLKGGFHLVDLNVCDNGEVEVETKPVYLKEPLPAGMGLPKVTFFCQIYADCCNEPLTEVDYPAGFIASIFKRGAAGTPTLFQIPDIERRPYSMDAEEENVRNYTEFAFYNPIDSQRYGIWLHQDSDSDFVYEIAKVRD